MPRTKAPPKTVILKFQKPLYSNDPKAMNEVLVYDERRKIQLFVPLTDDLRETFEVQGPKFYGMCTYDKHTKEVALQKVVSPRMW